VKRRGDLRLGIGCERSGEHRKAIKAGLDRADLQMVRAALEYEAEQAERNYLSELMVEIVPYRIKDDSLAKIVMEAGDDVVTQIEEAANA